MRDPATSAALLTWARTVKGSLERARLPFEGLWRDVRKNFEPTLGKALEDGRDNNEEAAKRDDEKIINSKPRDVVGRLASGLQSGITNQARQWFRLVEKGASEERKMPAAVRRTIDDATEVLQTTIAGSNIYTSLISMYMRLGQFGTACALLLPDEDTVVRLDVLDEGAYWIGQDRRGRVCTLLRRAEYTVRQLADEFGVDALPDAVRKDFEEGRTEEFRRVWNLVVPMGEVPRERRRRFGQHYFASMYWLDGEAEAEALLATRGFDYNPIIAPRWSQPTASAYGLGLGQIALPDAKELQSLEQAKMCLVANEVDPPMAVPESMRGTGVNMNPGAVNYFAAGIGGTSAGHIPIQPIDQRPKRLDYVNATIAEQEQRMGRLFYEDLFAMLLQIQMGEGKRQMTATEVAELASEKIALLGPILTRLNHDLLDPLVGGVYQICFMHAVEQLDQLYGDELLGWEWNGEARAAAAERYRTLLEIDEMDITVEYQSTLHAEQQSSTRMTGILHTLEFCGLVSNYDPQALDNIDLDRAVQLAARSYMEFGIIRDTKDVETMREGRARVQEQQMQLQQRQVDANVQAQQAKMLKDISEAQAAAGGDAFQPPQAGGMVA